MRKTKAGISLVLAIMILLSSFTAVFADDSDKSKVEDAFRSRVGDEYGKDGSVANELSELSTQDFSSINRDISYVLYRAFIASYMNDVSNYSSSSDDNYDKREIYKVNDGYSICNSKRDHEFLYHNCDLPTVFTGLMQNIFSTTGASGVQGAETTSAYSDSAIGLGMPNGIKKYSIPLDLKESNKKYTALELFGYNLPITTYLGEWDSIYINTEARLLSNFGFMDKIRLTGNTLFNGVSGFFSSLVNNFSWNPIKWISGAVSKGAGEALTTIMDTSDANVAATRAWGREHFPSTVYGGAHYVTDSMVIERANAAYMKYFQENFEEEAQKNEDLKPWIEIIPDKIPDIKELRSKYPEFSNQEEYDKYLSDLKKYEKELSEYKSDLTKYENCKGEDELNCGVAPKEPKEPTEVEPKPLTEEELYEYYQKDPVVQAFFKKASVKGLDSIIKDDSIKRFDDMRAKYYTEASARMKEDLRDGNSIMNLIAEKLSKAFYQKNQQFNPTAQLSHWVCLPKGQDKKHPNNIDLLTADYVFNSDGTRTESCSHVVLRPTIKGGLSGSGDVSSKDITDTRWQVYNKQNQSSSVMGIGPMSAKGANYAKQSGTFFSRLFVKITNTLLGISSGNVLKELQISTMMESFVKTTADSIFFPLAGLAIAISALYYFTKIFTGGIFGGAQVIRSIVGVILIFIIIMSLVIYPKQTVEAVDLIPSTIEEMISNALYGKNSAEGELCSTGNDVDATRSLQCEVWNIGVFTPWLHQQFGVTDWKQLDSENMQNKNKALVGTPTVEMGGNIRVNNWALYQLSITKTGNISQPDKDNRDGFLDKNMYRLVDLQFGPNNGANSDTRFADVWAGIDRPGTSGIMAAIASFAIMTTIGTFAIYKLSVSLSLVLNIGLITIMGIRSLLPNGNAHFKQYGQKIVALMGKRILITTYMMVVMKFLIAIQKGLV